MTDLPSPAIRALQLNAERLQQDINATQSQRQRGQQIAVADGAGNFRQPGGEGGYRRSIYTSGAIPNGQVVPASPAGVGGMPASFGIDPETIRALQERAARIDLTAGVQVTATHPNDQDGDDAGRILAPRRAGDSALYQGVVYYWDETEGQWLGAVEELTVAVASPAVQQYPAIGSSPYRRRIESLTITNRSGDGTAGTAGTGALLVDGAAVTLGTTLLPVSGYLALNVTGAGTGDFLIATITMRAA